MEGGVGLKHGQDFLGKELKAAIQFRRRQAAESKRANHMVERDRLVDIADFFEHLVRRAGRVQAAEELDRLDLGLCVRVELGIGFGHFAVELVALDAFQLARGKAVVVFNGVKQRAHIMLGQVLGFFGIVRNQDVE